MAVVGIAEEMPIRDGVAGQLGRRLYRRQFRVITDDPFDDASVVRVAPGLPQPYEPYITFGGSDPKALCRTVTPRQADKSRLIWHVTCEYDTEYDRFDNPLTEPPEITVSSEQYEQPLPGRARLTYDPTGTQPDSSDDPAVQGNFPGRAWGEGIVTSAGEPYDPPPTITQSRPVIKFVRNQTQSSFTIAFKMKFENTVNKFPWSGLEKRQAFLRSIEATTHVRKSSSTVIPDIYYLRCEYVFVLKPETWDLQLLDIGSYYLDYTDANNPKRVQFTVEGSEGTPRLGLLDNSNPAQPGKKLAAGGEAKYNRWQAYRETAFAELGINLNLALEARRARPG